MDANGTGTASGIKQALELIPKEELFMLVWSDLILSDNLKLPNGYEEELDENPADSHTFPRKNYIGISLSFTCRWKYENGQFSEEPSTEHGVAGLFQFQEKKWIEDVPENGELVKWMNKEKLKFGEMSLAGTRNLE